METQKVLGIIGVRSGSKSIQDKNIKPLNGKPLMGWIIEAAKKSKYVNRLIVSTDSQKYADIARSFGAEVPCLRPVEIAGDKSTDQEYLEHMLAWLKENEGYEPDIVARLMATVPLQSAEDIDGVIEEIIKDPNVDSAVVVSEARQHPLKALKIIPDEKGGDKLVSYFTESGRDVTPQPRQKYEKAYFRANIVAFRTSTLYKTNTLTGDRVKYYIIPQERAVDIDSQADFLIAEQLMRNMKARNSA